jgi:hypothetical protein
MRRFLGLSTVLALGLGCAFALSACSSGGSDAIPSGTANQLDDALDAIEQQADEGDCSGAADSAAGIADQIDGLDIDRELKQALIDAFERLQTLAADPETCEGITTQETTTQEETTTDEETTTEEQTTTEEEPPPTETQEPPPPQTQTTPTQPSGGGDSGGVGPGGGVSP